MMAARYEVFTKNLWAVFWITLFLLAFSALYFRGSRRVGSEVSPSPVPANISTFEACVEAGYPVAESYPRQCAVPGGPSFTEELDDDGMVACTMDAKICPDGSAVGRVGPNCEFAPCPNEES